MSSQAEELRKRRAALVARVDVERGIVMADLNRISGGLERADGWLAIARRVTPVAAVAAIALGFVVGPARIVRLLQAAAVPALLVRQILGRSTSGSDGSVARFPWFGRRS